MGRVRSARCGGCNWGGSRGGIGRRGPRFGECEWARPRLEG